MNKLQTLFVALALCLASTVALGQQKPRIANEGTIGDKWMLADGATLASATYPAHLARRETNVCISLAYTINPDGTTSDFAVAKQWNSESGEVAPVEGFWDAFANAGHDAVSQWRFKPRPEVSTAVPTRTVATLNFNGQANVDAAQLRSHCKISDLADHLAQLEFKRFERGDMNKQAEEHERMKIQRQQAAERQRRANPSPGG